MKTTSYRRHAMWGCGLICFFLATQTVLAQSNNDALPKDIRPRQLPPESAIPDQFRHRPRAPIVIGVNTPKPGLPSEATLPVTQTQRSPQSVVDNAHDELLRLNTSEDKRPWLRLQQQAYVDRIRSLCFSSDGQRLFVAGDDKHVIVHTLADDGTWNYERTIRWQVQRGDSGRIYAVAAAPELLAIGGRSATGSVGELLVLNPGTGELLQRLAGSQLQHEDRLTSIACSQESKDPAIISMDQRGRLLRWTKNPNGLWSPQQLADDPQHADELLLERTLHPVAAINRRLCAAPVAAGRTEKGAALWQVRLYDADDPSKSRMLLDKRQAHIGMVTAMAASAREARLASADESGQLFVWDLKKSASPARFQLDAFATSLSFSGDGKTLAIGSSGPKRGVALWDVSDTRVRRPIREDAVPLDVLACSISGNGKHLAYAQGGDVVIRNVGHRVEDQAVVRSTLPEPTRVAFSRAAPYRVAISTKGGDAPQFETVFAPGKGQLESEPIDAGQWISPLENQMGWEVRTDGETTWLEQQGQRRGSLPLSPSRHGRVKTVCWIPRNGQPFAVALGTYATEIYVYRLAQQGECPLLRKFRGHTGAVNSMCVSHDQRYLVSCGTDHTIQIWKLEDLGTSVAIDRWGATFADDNGSVIVQSIREDGPLYFRGVRQGDQVNSLIWNEPGVAQAHTVTESGPILDRLVRGAHDQLTAFEYQRGRAPMATFQSYPAWQPVASLIVSDKREWAFWTPAGYYDASFEGHKLFGWQVNRGPDVLPDFFLAAQAKAVLEKPEVMSKLLDAGSLDAAFQQQSAAIPANWSTVLTQHQELRPQITILEPQPLQAVEGPVLKVVAKVEVKQGQSLASTKAFANGVVSTRQELISRHNNGDHVEHHYEWLVPVPADSRLLIQVAVATEDETADLQSVHVTQRKAKSPPTARMFVVTAGVNDYHDAQVPHLKHAVDNALSVANALKSRTNTLYECEAITLLGDRLTKSTWQATLRDFADTLRNDAGPDDLLVIFLSGHGLQDNTTGQYYYVPSNARFSAIRSGQFADCLSFQDLAAFGDISCRKLVILDTCHSGAIQPLRQSELKVALRALQDDVFLTLTASEGSQEAVEEENKRLGRFTFRLLEGLAGTADATEGNRDGVVSLAEIVRYVQRTVAADSATSSIVQYPTAGPSELMDVVELPITARSLPTTSTARK